MTALGCLTGGVDVGFLEFGGLPLAGTEHLCSELGLQLGTSWLVIGTLGHLVRLTGCNCDKLALLELVDHFLVVGFE